MSQLPPGLRIVLMDDELAIQKLMKTVLEREGCEVRVAGNGKEGLKLMEEGEADLVITDLVMPEQEGLESIMLIKQKYPTVKIIAVSGGLQHGAIDMLPTANRLGANKTLRKPIRREELFDAIIEVMGD